jgi:MerR family transcriptional regulator, light-induced transcriptional regulator
MASTGSQHAQFLSCILAGDRRGAEAEALRFFEARGVTFLYQSIVRPALIEVGALWSQNRITVADEHLATAATQSAIAALYPRFPWPARGGHKAIVACPDGERHELGARMFADLLALDGWDDLFLGADVPIADLLQKTVEVRPPLLALSVSLEPHLPEVRVCVEEVRRQLPATRILLGGRATSRIHEAAQEFGADAILDDAVRGVEVARAWR